MAQGNAEYLAGQAGRLALWTKGLGPTLASAIVLLHGGNLSGPTAFDFALPGQRSLMDYLADDGVATIALSVRGYGGSDGPADPLDIGTDAAIDDLDTVVSWLQTRSGLARVHLLGWSWGGRVAGRYAERYPDRIDRLVLLDPAISGTPGGQEPTEPWRTSTAEWYFERLQPEHTDNAMRTAVVAHILQTDPRSPNGVHRERARGTVSVKPENLTRPTILLYGADAARSPSMEGELRREEFFDRLATDDKALVVIPGGGDFLQFQRPRFRLFETIAAFLRPAPVS